MLTARVVPEPLNPDDANAVAVCTSDDLAKIGHLARFEVEHDYNRVLLKRGGDVS